tara:strand:- start:351 stop:584 length:234 start_codon:yes stop_codon:yes gene_type:complete
MSTKEEILTLVEKLLRIENERKLLLEEQRELFDDYKERLDIKAVKAALRIAKIKSKLGDSEHEMETILDTIEDKITI